MNRRSSIIALILATPLALAADWPKWMGANRDDDWTETGIIDSFPADEL